MYQNFTLKSDNYEYNEKPDFITTTRIKTHSFPHKVQKTIQLNSFYSKLKAEKIFQNMDLNYF